VGARVTNRDPAQSLISLRRIAVWKSGYFFFAAFFGAAFAFGLALALAADLAAGFLAM